jgi:spermidine/putrescine transport system permease protein
VAISASGRSTPAWVPWVLLAPGVLWLVVFFAIPMARLGSIAWSDGGISTFVEVFSDNSAVVVRTFWYALASTLAAIALGYPLAYVIARRGGRAKGFLLGLVVLPFFTTYLLRAIAWRVLLGGNGPVVGFLQAVGLFGPDDGILATDLAVIGALTYNFLPFMVLPIYVSLEKIDRRLLEAGQDLYGGPVRTFRRVTLPLSLPGIFAGSLLTFIPAAGDFVNTEFVGSDRQRMIGSIIETNFAKEFLKPEMAALSFVLMALILAGVLVYARLLGTEDLL